MSSPFCWFRISQQCQRLCLQNPLVASISSEERHQQHQHQHQRHPMSRWPLPMEATTLNMFQNRLTVKGCQQFLLLKSKGSFEWLTCLERKSLVLLIFVSPFCYLGLSLFFICWLIVGKFSFFGNWCIIWRILCNFLFKVYEFELKLNMFLVLKISQFFVLFSVKRILF